MPEAAQRPLIFISHKVSDAAIAGELQSALDKEFLSYPRFFNASDDESLQPGTAWFDSIVNALRDCSVLLAVLSPAALASPWVHFESGAAWLQDAVVIPCCIGQVRKGSLPAPYDRLQAIDLDSPEDLNQLFRRLAEQAGMKVATKDRTELAERFAELWQTNTAAAPQQLDNADLGSRVEDRLAITWQYSNSATMQGLWAADYTQSVRLRTLADQLDSVLIEITPSLQAVTFDGPNRPIARLGEHERSSPGVIRLAHPHALGSRFASRLHFDPPLRRDDTAAYSVHIHFPAMKVGTRDRLIELLMDSDGRLRDYDYCGRRISRPCRQFVYEVQLPESLKAIPLQAEALLDGQPFEEEIGYLLGHSGAFTVQEVTGPDGEPRWIARIDRHNPPQYTTYRLNWRLPRRADLES
jgi:TIR domain-containing protein